jgi:ABC-type multidrug transport system permease subunit
LLGVLFAVTALGKDFPPPYLKDNLLTQFLVAGVLVLLMAALLCAVLTVQPRKYKFYEHNLSEMRKEWVKLFTHKSTWLARANWFFFAGTLLLAVLIGVLVFNN